MPSFEQVSYLPYTPQELFDLVLDVPSYPDFLPWCHGARIAERGTGYFLADLTVGIGPWRQVFTSRVVFDGPERIETTYARGALKHLHSVWRFQECPGQGTQVSFYVTFDFTSSLMQKAMEAIFQQAAEQMMKAFEKRAEALYDSNTFFKKNTVDKDNAR